jgi:glycosyltransferase involved in cell wall biosynthesis
MPRGYNSHPIRLVHLAGAPATYSVPLFRRLAADPRVDLTVVYASSEGVRSFDSDWFGDPQSWDVDLTSGYRSIFLRAADRTPALGDHFWSVRNWDIARLLEQGRYDVLSMHGYNGITYVLAAVTQRALGGEVLFREDQTLLDPKPLRNVIAKQLILRALFRQGRALYTNAENRRWFQSFGVPDERLFFSPFTADNDYFRQAATRLGPKRDQLKREFGIADGSGPVVVTVSRLAAKKQPLFLLEAFRRVREHQRCVLMFAGSGPLEQALRDRVHQQNIPDVLFPGFMNTSEIPRAYAVADLFVLLSRERETHGLVVNEAMNFGLPIIVSDKVGAAQDLVSTDHKGFVVSSRDPAPAAVVIERLVRDPELRAKMGAASLRRIADWNVETAAAGFIAAATDAVS